ncbi:4-(cytidine 5'-diphospho)-2-C-methyl-D-erythritol kinase [Dyadobacter pollutisoli]|jgi:4-diphosphocytidyl-2-C-methyl-D-erythritol kinase|uniref:4-diphosphocytidyl-2-C-methyl-D-erythritol kinase n=1 Tax=Dyadobacter pollutisoli TaxID=2910158 RepID=A0A9E8N7K5_9BACT|nr:4-(cytidine 5'-diphospho)-2-C-methyl-D-erythritol kinase [Dyadobacter pollutisoli]WAC11330.1 4-(cytidine 5'-diphospho)-2-C-methyl-D-erythritol kinase [Dyadobacter pollutisoli]
MLVFPNAKINLGLNIVEKRVDGFHNIESCFYPVGWTDALEITPAGQFTFQSDGIAIPGNGNDNLCAKAYQMLAVDYDLPPVKIHLLKAIPIGAGLGGGSADAAFTIKALNQQFNLQISHEKQLSYARRLGSDCAFFILNKPAYCFHRGDEFEDVSLSLAGKWIVMVNPGVHISTVEAYSGVQAKRSGKDLRTVLKEPVASWRDQIKNDFEATLFVKYPLLETIKNNLYNLGAFYASMSGSGSTLYGIFDEEKNLKENFRNYKVWQGFLD